MPQNMRPWKTHAVYAFDRLLPCKLQVWEWVVNRRIFDPFSEFSGRVSSRLILVSAYRALQGGLVLWYRLSPLAAL